MPALLEGDPLQTVGFQDVFQRAVLHCESAEKPVLDITDILVSLMDEQRNYCSYYMRRGGLDRLVLLEVISHGRLTADDEDSSVSSEGPDSAGPMLGSSGLGGPGEDRMSEESQIDGETPGDPACPPETRGRMMPKPTMMRPLAGKKRESAAFSSAIPWNLRRRRKPASSNPSSVVPTSLSARSRYCAAASRITRFMSETRCRQNSDHRGPRPAHREPRRSPAPLRLRSIQPRSRLSRRGYQVPRRFRRAHQARRR